MKLKKLSFAILAFLFFACSENEIRVGDSIQDDDLIITTSEELKALMNDQNKATFTFEEKIEFLSSWIANHHSSMNSPGARTMADEIVCVAQIYDGERDIYYTDVEVTTSNAYVYASVRIDLLDNPSAPQGFFGANANVYKNGVNVAGRITSGTNDPCLFAIDYSVSASARFDPLNSAPYYARVGIHCSED